ncbi:DUF3078 domain-containing protein [Leptobacterium flavescens]|uniref:DUF3078 domain-containing protein n=1 Tax=Leptobacterium flavescens TaxID=472055 RepID=A0A6P0UMQ7_9FLAO|nr:DUF3078 domain-containing protein [Leptobacterium flavescens]NER13148.1 DUF3078 domain-containing protein [Leptobacterium flavescens]
MKRLCIVCLLILGSTGVFAQEKKKEKEEPKEGWTSVGKATFLFNQAAFSNWVAGGVNNFSGTIAVNYDFNYLKGNWNWDNKIIAAFGLAKVNGNRFARKTDDRIEYNSLLGKKAGKNWYYSGFVNFKTQFASGFRFENDPDTGEEIRIEETHFFSPAYLQFGPGMLWKKSDNLKINIAPATARFIFVDSSLTLPDAAYFGVEEGESLRFELGGSVSAYYKFDPIKNVTLENILNLYSDYLNRPKNVDLDYQLNIVMKVNKYLTTNLAFQTIYDDNAIGRLQVRQIFGLGVNFGF